MIIIIMFKIDACHAVSTAKNGRIDSDHQSKLDSISLNKLFYRSLVDLYTTLYSMVSPIEIYE